MGCIVLSTLCCCLACVHLTWCLAVPVPSSASVEAESERQAVKFVMDSFYGDSASDDTRELVRAELRRTGLDFSSFTELKPEQWHNLLKLLFRNYYIKQQAASTRVTNILIDLLGLSLDTAASSSLHRVEAGVPKAIIEKVERWNTRSLRPCYEDSIFIGERTEFPPTSSSNRSSNRSSSSSSSSRHSSWLFRLQQSMLGVRLHRVTLGVFVSGESLERVRGRQVRALLMHSNSGSNQRQRLASNWVRVPGDATERSDFEVKIDATSATIRAVRAMYDANPGPLELSFVIQCDGCESWIIADYVTMDIQHKNTRRRSPRSTGQMHLPFDNELKEKGVRIFHNRSSNGSLTPTQICLLASVASNKSKKSCCLMHFNLNLAAHPEIVSPKQLSINYCTGECHAQSSVNAAHSFVLQNVANRQNSGIGQKMRNDISLCCVPASYRDYRILVQRKAEGATKPSIALSTIEDLSAASCTCA